MREPCSDAFGHDANAKEYVAAAGAEEEDERRRKQHEAASAAVVNPFDGHTGSPTSSGMVGGAASSGVLRELLGQVPS